ncbi:MAG: hypothetical protein KAK01_07310, partial [Candidatus Marinimicrobia bacterium]|nr:hypothetical protein [Candidatus Neomarinimicrobiota bacterium]
HILPPNLSDLGIFLDQALRFDGTVENDNHVILPHDGGLAFTGPMTIEAWAYLEEYRDWDYFVASSHCHSMMLGWGGDFLFHWLDDEGWKSIGVGRNVIPLQRWTHLAITRDDNNLIYFYVNGLLVAVRQVTTPTHPEYDTEMVIGRSGGPDDPPQFRFFGTVDEVSIWSVTRSQNELMDDMTIGLTGAEPGLAGYWPFNGTGEDFSPSGFNAIVSGSQYVDSDVSVITWEPVTFQVDMSVQIEAGNFLVGTDQLVLRGSFNGWAGNNQELLDGDTDSIYTTTISLPSSLIGDNFEYKFVVAEDGWETRPNRSFVMESGGQVLDVVYFNDVIDTGPMDEQNTGAAYFPGEPYNWVRVTDNNPVNPSANPSAYQITGNTITVEAWVFPMSLPDGTLWRFVHRPDPVDPPAGIYTLAIEDWGGEAHFIFLLSDGVDPNNRGGVGDHTATVEAGRWYH